MITIYTYIGEEHKLFFLFKTPIMVLLLTQMRKWDTQKIPSLFLFPPTPHHPSKKNQKKKKKKTRGVSHTLWPCHLHFKSTLRKKKNYGKSKYFTMQKN
jgi:hypothetical protein